MNASRSSVNLPGRYSDLGRIGAGSFGEVRRVHDMVLDRVVAMKLLHAEFAAVPHVRRRFLVEATITAQLQHPGIVSVYDRGEHSDGRVWYTMQEVRGRTLGTVIDELHAHKTWTHFAPTPSGWTFRRVIDAFARIVQAIAYAHSRNVVHRDLKPENLMTGEFGEVLVMDWGLARRTTVDTASADAFPMPTGNTLPGMTRHGDILGTPAFMAPEQASGDSSLHGPASDVYALGAVLFCALTGKVPHSGSVRGVLAQLRAGKQARVHEAAENGPPLPEELVAACERAMRPVIRERYESADAFAADIVSWLDGVRRREQALAALEHARTLEPEIAALRMQAADAQARARAIQGEIKPFDSIEKKRPAWALEDESLRLGRAAALAETRWTEAVHGALSLDPDLSDAHEMLADHHRERLVEAELEHRHEDMARAEEMLRIHDRGRHAAFLRGEGRLSLVTDPPGAEVIVDRFVPQDRRLVPVFEKNLGPTPLIEAPLQRGSYLLRIRAPGRAEVRYPVLISRAGHWDGIAPGETEPYPIVLPKIDELGPNDMYVPAGWCWIGGDPLAADSLPQKRIWVDAFVMGKYPVTTAEYLAFLNDLVAQGRQQDARAACPKLSGVEEVAFKLDEHGCYGLPPDREGLHWRFDWPMAHVSWHGAMAYARWFSEKTGQSWRLPNELEREKSRSRCRWPNYALGRPSRCDIRVRVGSHRGTPGQTDLQLYPLDESVYGVRAMAGHIRDWCINLWKIDGPNVERGRLKLDPAPSIDDDFPNYSGRRVGQLDRAKSRSCSIWSSSRHRLAERGIAHCQTLAPWRARGLEGAITTVRGWTFSRKTYYRTPDSRAWFLQSLKQLPSA